MQDVLAAAVKRDRFGSRSMRAGMALLSVVAIAVLGCSGNGKSRTVIDVTVEVEAGLDIDTVSVTASAQGRENFKLDLPPASPAHTPIHVSGISNGTLVSIEVRGTKGANTVVIARGQVTLRSDETVFIMLRLMLDCRGVLSCPAHQTCEGGLCVPISPSGGTGGLGGNAGAGGRPGTAGIGGGGNTAGIGGAGVLGSGGSSTGGSGSGGAGTGGAATGGNATGGAATGGSATGGAATGGTGTGGAATGGAATGGRGTGGVGTGGAGTGGGTGGTPCNPVPEQCFNGADDDCDRSVDCADSDCQATAMCVPEPPGGFAHGIRVGASDPCPAGFTASSTVVGRNLMYDGSCTGCACSVSGTKCIPTVSFFHTVGDCLTDQNASVAPELFTSCTDQAYSPVDADGTTGAKLEAVRAEATCTSNGTPTPTPATWGESYKFCERTPGGLGGGCSPGQVCVARNMAKLCILASGAAFCPTAFNDSVSASAWFTGHTGTRTCSGCTCAVLGGRCLLPAVQIHRGYSCEMPVYMVSGIGDVQCQDVSYGTIATYVGGVEPASCSGEATATGTLTPSGQQTLCCLP
jgi:hypothetical protein